MCSLKKLTHPLHIDIFFHVCILFVQKFSPFLLSFYLHFSRVVCLFVISPSPTADG